MLFGGLGKGVNALGLSKGLTSIDDMLAKKLSSEMSDEVRYPTIIPIMSNMRLLRTKVEKKRITPITTVAPTKAPTIVAKNPVRPLPAIHELPANIMMATPSEAPVSIPNIEGPASGLLKVVCSSNPATARLQPARSAVVA